MPHSMHHSAVDEWRNPIDSHTLCWQAGQHRLGVEIIRIRFSFSAAANKLEVLKGRNQVHNQDLLFMAPRQNKEGDGSCRKWVVFVAVLGATTN
jgi:hypothetical protein